MYNDEKTRETIRKQANVYNKTTTALNNGDIPTEGYFDAHETHMTG